MPSIPMSTHPLDNLPPLLPTTSTPDDKYSDETKLLMNRSELEGITSSHSQKHTPSHSHSNSPKHTPKHSPKPFTAVKKENKPESISHHKTIERKNNLETPSIYTYANQGLIDKVSKLLNTSSSMKVDDRNPVTGRTLLHDACSSGDVVLAKLLINTFSANVNVKTYIGSESCLHLSVHNSQRAIVFLLLNTVGVDVDVVSKYGCTPLFYCILRSIAALLIDAGADISWRNEGGYGVISYIQEQHHHKYNGDDGDGDDDGGNESESSIKYKQLLKYLNEVYLKTNKSQHMQARESQNAQRALDSVNRLGAEEFKNRPRMEKFKSKVQRDYSRWRNGTREQKEEISRRAAEGGKKMS